MQSPSNSQAKAINHGEGPMLVLAGPGSGKTFVIIQRILNLIHEKHIKPENILVISFSKASTLELKHRFQKQFKEIQSEKIQFRELQTKEEQSKKLTNESRAQVNFATFHACFFHILKETYHYTSQDIITEKQKRDILKTILLNPIYEKKNVKGEQEKKEQFNQIGQQKITREQNENNQNELKNIAEKVEDYLQKISYYKNKETKELKEKEAKQFRRIFHEYNQEMHQRHKLDFDKK